MRVLEGSQYGWLLEVLSAFNNGDLHAYDSLCSQHAAALNGQPALVSHERELRQKITILCLTELISKCELSGWANLDCLLFSRCRCGCIGLPSSRRPHHY